MAASLATLCTDLLAETTILDALVRPLDAAGWATPSAAVGWTVRDQVVHLARSDEAARLSVTEPGRFSEMKEVAARDRSAWIEWVVALDAGVTGEEGRTWLHEERARLVDAVRGLDPSRRVQWFGPDMTLASLVTARIMETWAHGEDCFEALGVEHTSSSALAHVAFIGARSMPSSFRVHGRPVPDVPVRVEVTAPDGASWTFGDAAARDAVRGPAVDFCLVVTQRRHVADTDLVTDGAVAAEWMAIAQAFAGPPGPGREPGRRARPNEQGSAREVRTR